MPENQNAAVRIGQLNLRIPGKSADTAHRVAGGVAKGLAREAPVGTQRHFGALTVRVRAPAGASEAELSDAVAEAIRRVLRK
jgi:hypothetical protein